MPGGYGTYFWHNGFGITDYVTDKAIFAGLLRGERSVTEAAMRTDYPRYWHGYAVLLRPMSACLSIINIRYLNMMLLMGLLMGCHVRMRALLGRWHAPVFAAGLLMSFFLIAPFCQQYVTVYLLTLLGCFGLLAYWRRVRSELPLFFLTLGSLTCFFDFLTFPVLALGYPLVCCLLLSLRDGEPKAVLYRRLLGLSAVWMAAYVLTWLGKALVGSLLTSVDVLGNMLAQVALRISGGVKEGSEPVTVGEAIGINLETFFMGSNIAFFALFLIVSAVLAIRRHPTAMEWRQALPVLVVALWPFVWYCVLRNHVRMHFWMTNKQLSVTVFAACAYFAAVAHGRDGPKNRASD